MLNLGRLQVLCEVVNRGSFSAAADALSYTQSAVSQAIARLEAETGATLVIRDRRGARPTAAGITLVSHAETIFAQVEAAEGELEDIGPRLRAGEFDLALLFEFPGVQPRRERPGAGLRSVTLLEDPMD